MQRLLGVFRRYPIVVLLPVLLVGGFVFRSYLPGAASDLQVGDCFDEPAQTAEIQEVQRRPCQDSHDAEVFSVLNHPAGQGDPYPISLTLERFIDEQCLPAFGSYTGTAFESQNELTVGWFYPTFESWGSGDREVTCYLVRPDGQQLTGSRRAAQ